MDLNWDPSWSGLREEGRRDSPVAHVSGGEQNRAKNEVCLCKTDVSKLARGGEIQNRRAI